MLNYHINYVLAVISTEETDRKTTSKKKKTRTGCFVTEIKAEENLKTDVKKRETEKRLEV